MRVPVYTACTSRLCVPFDSDRQYMKNPHSRMRVRIVLRLRSGTGDFPNKHDKRLNWYKYNVKLIKQGKLSPEREQMIHELEEMRSGCHTGGRRKV